MDVLPEADGNTSFESTCSSIHNPAAFTYQRTAPVQLQKADGRRIWVSSLRPCRASRPAALPGHDASVGHHDT